MFTSLELKALIFLGVMAVSAFGGGLLVHKLDAARYAKLELSYAKAQIAAEAAAVAEQKRLDDITTAAAQREAANQSRLAAQAKAALEEIQTHVKNRPTDCFSYGFIRVLDARLYGVLAERLPLPAGKSDDACTAFTSTSLARAIGAIIDTAIANAEQQNAMAQFFRDTQKK